MIVDSIKLIRNSPSATEVGSLLDYQNKVRAAYEAGVRIRAKMQHNFDDQGGEAAIDWSGIESLYGIPAGATSVGTTAVGKRMYDYINGSVGGMEGLFTTNAAKELTEVIL